jgi:hypothetical protein
MKDLPDVSAYRKGVSEVEGFVSGRKHAVIAICALVLSIVTTAAVTGLEWFASVYVPDWKTSETDQAMALSGVLGLVGLQAVIVAVLTPVAFLFWIHRVVRNAAVLGPAPKTSPREAVVAWFIPVVAYVWPYRIVRELYATTAWRGEHVAGDWLESAPWLFPVWWLTWIVAQISGNMSFRHSLSDNPASVELATTIDRVALPFTVIAALGATAVVRSITVRQEAQVGRARDGGTIGV